MSHSLKFNFRLYIIYCSNKYRPPPTNVVRKATGNNNEKKKKRIKNVLHEFVTKKLKNPVCVDGTAFVADDQLIRIARNADSLSIEFRRNAVPN